MNSYDRVMGAIKGEKIDRIPNLCLVMSYAAKEIGVPYSEFIQDYRLLAKGMLACCEKYDLDVLSVCSDPMREASGFGADVVFPHNGVPYAKEPLIKDITDVQKLQIVDPLSARRMNDRIEAIRLLKEQVKQEIPVIGWVEGSVAEACDLMGISEFMCEMLDDEEEVFSLLDICAEQAIWFAKEQIRAGADIIGIGDAATSLIGPALFEKYALPYQQKIIQSIQDMGAMAKLHICGNLNSVLHLVAQSGANIIDLDHMVHVEEACKLFPEESCINGNFDPVTILLQGSHEQIEAEVIRCMNYSKIHRCAVAAGCEVPFDTPQSNLKKVSEVLQLH